MTEQEQAQVLARWLEQPAGTPPPEGLDPDVVESVYAMRPDLAPASSLSADDILAGFDFGMAAAAPIAEVGGAGEMPKTEVSAAPRSWAPANRVAGLGVLLATAATLLLVAIPALESGEIMESAVAPEADMAPARGADPIASFGDERSYDKSAEPPTKTVAAAEEAQQQEVGGLVTSTAPGGDAVADAAVEGDEMQYLPEQRARMTGEDTLIPEAAEALRQVDSFDQDAVAVVDDLALAEDEAAGFAEMDAPAAAAPPSTSDDYYGSKGVSEAPKSKKSRRESKEEASNEAPLPDNRRAAVPEDYDPNAWRATVDAITIAKVDDALRKAQAEAQLGNYGRAADLMAGLIGPPEDAGRFCAIQAAEFRKAAGDISGAIRHVQDGLALSSSNDPYRAKLFQLYGDYLLLGGDEDNAEIQYDEANRLNRRRGL